MSTRVLKASSVLRKLPRQARSRATVDIIVEAGARVLGATGWEGFTTNKVAARSGVSIGSLYQYFPNKAALVAAIRERHLSDCLAVLRDTAGSDLTDVALLRHLVGGLITVHDTSPGLHRVLLEDVPKDHTDMVDPLNTYEREYIGHYTTIVARLICHGDRGRAGQVALIISDAIDGVIHNAVRRGNLRCPSLQTELVFLCMRYVCCDRAA